MATEQGKQDPQTVGSNSAPAIGGQKHDPGYERGSSHPAGSSATTEAAAGIPQQAGAVEQSVESPVDQPGLANQAGSQPGTGDPSDAEVQSGRIEDHPEDQNSG